MVRASGQQGLGAVQQGVGGGHVDGPRRRDAVQAHAEDGRRAGQKAVGGQRHGVRVEVHARHRCQSTLDCLRPVPNRGGPAAADWRNAGHVERGDGDVPGPAGGVDHPDVGRPPLLHGRLQRQTQQESGDPRRRLAQGPPLAGLLGQQLVGVAEGVAVRAVLVFEGGVPIPELLDGGPGGGAERLLPQRQYGRIGERGQGGVAVGEALQGLEQAVRARRAVVGRGQAVVMSVPDEGRSMGPEGRRALLASVAPDRGGDLVVGGGGQGARGHLSSQGRWSTGRRSSRPTLWRSRRGPCPARQPGRSRRSPRPCRRPWGPGGRECGRGRCRRRGPSWSAQPVG